MNILNIDGQVDIKTKIMSYLGDISLVYMSRVNKLFNRIYKSEKLDQLKEIYTSEELSEHLATFRKMIEMKTDYTIKYDFFQKIPSIIKELSKDEVLEQLPDKVYMDLKLMIGICRHDRDFVFEYMKENKIQSSKHWKFFIKLQFNKSVAKLYKETLEKNE